MGVWWDWLAGHDARRWGRKLLRRKFPHVRGFSPETFEAIARGDLEIADDDPQLGYIVEPREGE